MHHLAAIALVGLSVAAAATAETWTVRKLPGCDDLPARMATYYEPVKAPAAAGAPQYKLPVDLAKVGNPDWAGKVPRLVDGGAMKRCREFLSANGFAAIGAGRTDDVAAFYEAVKTSGLPVFITSDSLLHLYHVQFDETLRGIEEREFSRDAALISGAIQAEALRLHAVLDGDLKDAARLLVGYAAVPGAFLAQTDLGAEAAAALKELSALPERPDWTRRTAFARTHGEVIRAAAAEQKVGPAGLVYDPAAMKTVLAKYAKAHPARADAGERVPAIVADDVRAELALVAAHEGPAPSPLFAYKEDYSQYVPRGHYTRSKKLRQYFKALMWYGRMTFLIRGRTDGVKGVISLAEARRQTLAACMLAGMMATKLPDGRTLAAAWDRLYAVTAYYVGLADDLTPYEYRSALRGAVGESVTGADLADAGHFFEVRKKLAAMRKPEIYSGLGDLGGPPAAVADEKTLAEALGMTQGMRLMGQRYIPDSYMMGRLVYPTVGPFTGGGAPLTLVRSEGGPIRGFPRGLDVMAVLGAARARHWLKQLGDDQYQRYDETLAGLAKQFGEVDEAGWNRNMYWSWLYALKALLREYPGTYPTFMQTQAWRDKQLSAALASWAQLRHDTILYAKQSYTMQAEGMPPAPRMVEGYVEPVPQFYARLLALTRMTIKGLGDFKVLDANGMTRLAALEQVVARLLALSQAELANKKLSAADYAFIREFGDRLKAVVAGVNQDGLETTIVADVHTDLNSRQVLEEGTGYLHYVLVVYPMPDGGTVVGAGPVLSHYEFRHPMAERLTDEAWKEMLRGRKAPSLPEWAKTFTAGAP